MPVCTSGASECSRTAPADCLIRRSGKREAQLHAGGFPLAPTRTRSGLHANGMGDPRAGNTAKKSDVQAALGYLRLARHRTRKGRDGITVCRVTDCRASGGRAVYRQASLGPAV
jgi:hypothetical protein